jgi:hypothetical protein
MGKLPKGMTFEISQRKLEDAFFAKEDNRLIEQLAIMEKMKENKESLRKVSGITREDVLEKLVAMNVRPETLVCLGMVPLIEIAWADGEIDEKEQAAMLKALVAAGFEKGSINYTVIESWIKHQPPKQLLTAWVHYARGLCGNLTAEETQRFRNKIFDRAVQIAVASGGFLGLGNKISDAEQKVIDMLMSAFEK